MRVRIETAPATSGIHSAADPFVSATEAVPDGGRDLGRIIGDRQHDHRAVLAGLGM